MDTSIAGLLEPLTPYSEDVLRGTFRDNAQRIYPHRDPPPGTSV